MPNPEPVNNAPQQAQPAVRRLTQPDLEARLNEIIARDPGNVTQWTITDEPMLRGEMPTLRTTPPPNNRTTGGRRRTTAPPPTPEQPTVTNVRIETVRLVEQGTMNVRGLYTTNGELEDRLDFNIYVDMGRALQPYGHALMQQIARTLEHALTLPPPPRREIPNPTVGERMYNMLGLFQDHLEDNEALVQELDALRVEYERLTPRGDRF